MNFGFSMVFFLQFGLGGAGVQIVETRIFLRGTVMNESIFTWKTCKTTMEKKKFRPMGKVWGEAWQGTWVWTFCFFLFFLVFPLFFAVWPKPRENKKKKFRPMGKVWAIHTQTKKPKKQKTKKPKKTKNQKNKKTKKKTRLHTPRGGGQMQSVGSCLFGFLGFFCFLFFWFFCFLVCVWIAIADVLSRDCQALSLVALEARSIHYSTAMFAMT